MARYRKGKSRNCIAKSKAKSDERYRQAIVQKRLAAFEERHEAADGVSLVSPSIPEKDGWANTFYQDIGTEGASVEVRTGGNISGDEASKGLFATRVIDVGCHICPYVGNIMNDQELIGMKRSACQYVMHVGEGMWCNAADVDVDVGYLVGDESGVLTKQPCPPNYGKFCNTIDKDDIGQSDRVFNCKWEYCEDGRAEVWLVSTRSIAVGEELLSDYGKGFKIGKVVDKPLTGRDIGSRVSSSKPARKRKRLGVSATSVDSSRKEVKSRRGNECYTRVSRARLRSDGK